MGKRSCVKLLILLALYLFLKESIIAQCIVSYEIDNISNLIINKTEKFKKNLIIKSEDEVNDYIIKFRTSPYSSFVPTKYKPMKPYSNTQVLLNQLLLNIRNNSVHEVSEDVKQLNYSYKDIKKKEVFHGNSLENFTNKLKNSKNKLSSGNSSKDEYQESIYLKEYDGESSKKKIRYNTTSKIVFRESTDPPIKSNPEERHVRQAVIVAWKNTLAEENEQNEFVQPYIISEMHYDKIKQSDNYKIEIQAHNGLIKIFEEEMNYVIDNHRHLKYLGISIFEFTHEVDEEKLKSLINKVSTCLQQIRYITTENLSVPISSPSYNILEEMIEPGLGEADEMPDEFIFRENGDFMNRKTTSPFTIPNEWRHLKSNTQWPFWITRMPIAWNRFGTGSEVKMEERPIILIADSGVDIHHEDLKDNIYVNLKELHGLEGVDDDENGYIDDINGINLIPQNNYNDDCGSRMKYDNRNLCDFIGHGTQVAGVAGSVGNNSCGIASPNWSARILTCKMTYRFTETFICVDYAIQQKSRISVHSYYHSDSSVLLNSIWGVALQRAAAYNHTIFFSAGNKKLNHDEYHSHLAFSVKHKNLITVAASTAVGTLANFSDYGRRTVNIAAPGTFIFTTHNGGGYGYVEGTSFAAPLVASIASLMIAYNPSLSYTELRDILVKTSIKKRFSNLVNVESGGLINGEAAIESAIVGGGWIDANEKIDKLVLKANKDLIIPLTFNGYDRGTYESKLIVDIINENNNQVLERKEIPLKIACEVVPYLNKISLETVDITRSSMHDNPKTVPLHNIGGGLLYVQILNSTINNISLEYKQNQSFDSDDNEFYVTYSSRWIIVPEDDLVFLKARCNHNVVGRYKAVFPILAIEGPDHKETIYNLKVICTVLPLEVSEIILSIDFDKINTLGYL